MTPRAVLAGLAAVAVISAITPDAAGQSGGGFELTWSTSDAGGATSVGGALSLVSTPGQPDAGSSSGASFAHDGGFSPGVCGGTIETYGTGCSGTGGFVPQFAMGGCPSTGYDVTLDISQGLGGSQAFLFIGLGPASLAMGGGCTLNVSPLVGAPIGPFPLFGAGPGNGAISVPITVPNSVPAFVFPVTLQVFVADPTAPSGVGFSNSNGVQLTLG